MKNPYNPITEPASYRFFEDKHNNFRELKDSDISLVSFDNKFPECKKHGAMNKVSKFETGAYWRCTDLICRAGCEQYKIKL